MELRINPELCQGHGRCYDLAPALFGADDEGYGQVAGDGAVPPGLQDQARLAVANCPERAVDLLDADAAANVADAAEESRDDS